MIDAYKAKEGSLRQLADRFKVSLSFVQRLVRRNRYTGKVDAKPHGGGAIAKIKVDDLPTLQQLVDEQPDGILEELCERYCIKSGVSVSVATMHRAVQRLNLTTKKNSVCQ